MSDAISHTGNTLVWFRRGLIPGKSVQDAGHDIICQPENTVLCLQHIEDGAQDHDSSEMTFFALISKTSWIWT